MGLALSAHISWLFGEREYLDRAAAARNAGFRWIESDWPDEADLGGLPAAIEEAGVQVALLNCRAGDTKHGERGFLNDPARRAEAEAAFAAAADLAQRVRATNLNLLVGRALPGRLSIQRNAVVSALREFGAQASARGLRIVVEPINAVEHPGYLAPTPKAAAELIAAADSDAVRLLLDVYHLAWSGTDPVATIDDYADLIGHVQISDWPGRGAPGTGRLDLLRVLERLEASGYTKAVGLEFEPRGATEESLTFLRDGSGWPQL